MKELYIHIGQAKTGTSTIQAFLVLNRELLRKKGLYYPLIRGEYVVRDKNLALAGNAYGMWELGRPLEQMGKTQIEYVHKMKKWFEHDNKVLISEEGLWTCNAEFYKNCLSLLNDVSDVRIKVIVYLRRQDERLESLWNECVKSGNYSKSCMEFCNEHTDVDEDYYTQLEMISGVIGKENVIVKNYDTECFLDGNKFLADFMSIFGFTDISMFKIPEFQVNPSLSKDMLEIIRITNEVPSIMLLDVEMRRIKKELMEFRQNAEEVLHAPSFLTYKERRTILDRCADGNKKIGQKYFGIDRSPFPELKDKFVPKQHDHKYENLPGGV